MNARQCRPPAAPGCQLQDTYLDAAPRLGRLQLLIWARAGKEILNLKSSKQKKNCNSKTHTFRCILIRCNSGKLLGAYFRLSMSNFALKRVLCKQVIFGTRPPWLYIVKRNVLPARSEVCLTITTVHFITEICQTKITTNIRYLPKTKPASDDTCG